MKELVLYKNLIKRYLFYLLIFSSILFITDLFFNNMPIIEMISSISNYIFFYTALIFSFNYYLFKIFISNGISRQKLYKIKIYLLLSFSIIINMIGFIINLFKFNILDKTHYGLYYQLYFHFFNSYTINIISMFIVGLISIMLVILLINTLGTLLSIFNVIGKIITFICTYFVLTIILSFIGIYSELLGGSNNVQYIFALITGLNSATRNGYNGNPINISITFIICIIVLLIINYKLTKITQVRK